MAEEAHERLARYREAAGKSVEELGAALSLGPGWYADLETEPEELFEIQLGRLIQLCRLLGITPAMLFAEDPAEPLAPVAFSEVVDQLHVYMAAESLTMEELEDEVGWFMEWLFEDPAKVHEWTIDGLIDLCDLLEINWLAVLMGLFQDLNEGQAG